MEYLPKTSIKISKQTRDLLKTMAGYNGCVTIEDVTNFLIRFYNENKNNVDQKPSLGQPKE